MLEDAIPNKGRFFSFLKTIPVKVILNDKAALLGAARFAILKGETPN